MRKRVGNRLPTFSKSQATLLKGSFDFVGINHYTTLYAYNVAVSLHDYIEDSGVLTFPFNGTNVIGERANSLWLYIVPHGMKSTVNYIKQKYGNPLIIVTENGNLKTRKQMRFLNDNIKLHFIM
ncbi:hypothetical protein V8G54_014884 [Vigna mungo]|uniref:Beta-glucosidase n=1 Tax=Vigna mungo TaxID=3915 RepID=A0AAQ3RZW2_VIGMU